MEINLKKLGEQAIESTTGTKKMRLSENAQSMVFQLFTKNVYSNPIGTVVREITSNCFDSHVEAGVKDMPVVIRKSFDDETETTYLSFIDYGVGMSPDRVDNIYSVYFESTKRVDNEQIGGFGIGGKTPLAYKRSTGLGEGEYDNSFYVITTYEGQKYVYMVYEGAESPEVSLLHKEPTTDGNGTEIRIPVLKNDLPVFEREMIRQLYYFENIVFEGFEESQYVKNDYQIVRAKSFFYRGDEYQNQAHVCLGRVAYPIDFDALGLRMGDYGVPIAIRLNVGDINVTVSRESLDYSEKTIKLLKSKLEEAKQELIDITSKKFADITTLEDYFMVKNKFGYIKMSNGGNIHIANIMSVKDLKFDNFKFNHLKMPTDKQLYSLFFTSRIYGKKPSKNSWRRTSDESFDGGYESIMERKNVYYIDREFERKIIKQAYLNYIHKTYFIIREADLIGWEKKETIMSLFNIKLGVALYDDEGNPTDVMQDILNVRDAYFEIIKNYRKDYHELDVPEDFKLERKRNVISADVRKSVISSKIMGSYGKHKIPVGNLIDFPNIIFYGTQEDEVVLDGAQRIHSKLFRSGYCNGFSDYYKNFEFSGDKKQGVMFIMVAKNNIKYFQHCKKAYHISEYYWRMLHRKKDDVMSYFNNNDVVTEYDGLSDLYKNKKFGLVSPVWGKHIEELNVLVVKLKEQRSKGLDNVKFYLQRYFDLSNAAMTDEGKEILKQVEDLKMLQEVNQKYLLHINVDYRGDYLDTQPELVEILQKVMVL